MNNIAVGVVCGILLVIIVAVGIFMYLKMKKDWESKMEEQDRKILKQSVTLAVQERESCMRQKWNAKKHANLQNESNTLNNNVHDFVRMTASNLYDKDIPIQQRMTDNVRNKIIYTNDEMRQMHSEKKRAMKKLEGASRQTLSNFVELDRFVSTLKGDVQQLNKNVDETLAALSPLQHAAQSATINPRIMKKFGPMVDDMQSRLKELQVRVNIIHEMQQAENDAMQLVNPERIFAQERELSRVTQDAAAAQSGMSKIISSNGTDLLQAKLNEISNTLNELNTLLNKPTRSVLRCAGSTCVNEDQFKKLTALVSS